MAATAAERMRKHRQALREQGVQFVQVTPDQAQLDELRRLYLISGEGDTFVAWMTKCLMSGAKFRANSGGKMPAGRKAK